MNQRNASMTVIGAGSAPDLLLPLPWQEMATRLSSGAMTLNISQRLNATAVTPRFSPMCLFPYTPS